MLPTIEMLDQARDGIALEAYFEILVNIADKRFMNSNITQAEYDAWYYAAGAAYEEKMSEFYPQPALQSYSDFIEG